MAIHMTEEGSVLDVSLSGKATKSDYERFVPEVESFIKKHGKIDVLVRMHDFHGWDAGGLWEDIKFNVKHFSDVRRLALVGDNKWEKWMAAFCKPFTAAKIKYFERDQEPSARAWVEEGVEAAV